MGIFDLFKSKEELKENSPWLTIESMEDLNKAVEDSKHTKVAIFKHSTSCFISKMVLKNFETDLNKHAPDGYKFYYLDLLSFRPISNQIAEQFLVRHESPQIIVLENGAAVYKASHENINLELLP
ncbi:general stress protein [Elizabethkingia miricola]|uniref:General stress protein n=1 Tax=Elizabethkingia miricola TaxID=172045 RepID=A0ABD4DRF1_ELIMR|nr:MULTISPECIES: bacillithiol system redox-active protein YtxJ [Elizabethkingia]KUY20768.1 general stress protein [Elizabethkingia miricola]MCL1653034.1 bacillithiol system redox-active protein YtxJ [Elizabethkingia miricola]MCL1677822.1 bacillithiol system redox-active protein YtxJ [Elizabethkingia miricola]OPC70589.1 general stress protein [Elizabethkingia miricola]OPC74598.1 general stress protein [Elizabethkingia miricola]